MWLKTPSPITQEIHFIGDFHYSSYLFVGEKSLLYSGGVTAFGPMVHAQLKKILGDERALDYLVVSHAHFDGVGMVPHLRRMYPGLQVLASRETALSLAEPAQLRWVRQQNEELITRYGKQHRFPHVDLAYTSGISVDRVIAGGELLEIGERSSLRVIETPGHCQGEIALFHTSTKTLLVGDILGWHSAPQKTLVHFSHAFRPLLDSVASLSELMPRRVAMSHFGVLSEADAVRIFQLTLDSAQAQYERIRQLLLRDTPDEKICQEFMVAGYIEGLRILPVSSFLNGVRGMIDAVAIDAGIG